MEALKENSDEPLFEIDENEIILNEPANSEKLIPPLTCRSDLKTYFQMALDNGISFKQVNSFAAAVSLDNTRTDSLGLKLLFQKWCEKGNRVWLCPYSRISKLDESLLKFGGDRLVLKEIVLLLVKFAEQGISPAAFMQYVVAPRLAQDFDWRNWAKNHLGSLESIAYVILRLRVSENFQEEYFHSGSFKIARDIILVKYAGSPLARIRKEELENEYFIKQYSETWEKFKFDHYLFLAFMRWNILPLLYVLSGKIETIQITRILSKLPELYNQLKAELPDELYHWDTLPDISLYGPYFNHGYMERKNQGYNNGDLINEMISFVSLLITLISRRSGINLCGYIARNLVARKNSLLTGQVVQLISVLRDEDGMHLLRWHFVRLLQFKSPERDNYITLIIENDGCDPEYPEPEVIFNNRNAYLHPENLRILLKVLGLEYKDVKNRSPKGLLQAWLAKNPEHSEQVENCINDILTGKDNLWGWDTVAGLDDINKELYPLILQSTIPGSKGIKIFYSEKINNFTGLYKKYKSVNFGREINHDYSFKLPVEKKKDTSRFDEQAIRKNINTGLFEKFINALKENISPDLNITGITVNDRQIQFKKTITELKNKTNPNDDNQKQSQKHQASANFLQSKTEAMEDILKIFPSLGENEKLVLMIYLGPELCEAGDDYYTNLLHALILRYPKSRLKEQSEFLEKDIAIQSIALGQIYHLITFQNEILTELMNDQQIAGFHREEDGFLQLISPFLITKSKQVRMDSLEAALKKIFEFARFIAEKNKWEELVKKENTITNDQYRIICSPSFIDAYYGDMGGTCLSAYPDHILKPELYNFRIVNEKEKQIIGMFLVYISDKGIPSRKIQRFMAVFSINPLHSELLHMSKRIQLMLYSHIRTVIASISAQHNLPVVLAGVKQYGILSNDSNFADLIKKTEINVKKGRYLEDAWNTDIYYTRNEYAKGILLKF